MSTTLTIKPGGGGDYPDAATWEADLGTGDQIGEGYRGNLGGVYIDDASPDTIRLTVPDAEMHAMQKLGSLAAVAHMLGQAQVGRNNVTVEKLYLKDDGEFSCGCGIYGVSDCVLRRCVIDAAIGFGRPVEVAVFGAGTMTGAIVENNAIYTNRNMEFGEGSALYLGGNSSDASNITMSGIVIRNNSIYEAHPDLAAASVYIEAGESSTGQVVITATMENNVVMQAGSGEAYLSVVTGGTLNMTSNNNASHDATADDFGGSNHQTGETFADWFNGASDLRLKASSPGIDTGKTIAGVTTDALGTARPQGAAYDIGAFEVVPSGEPSLGGVRARRLRRWRRG